ncbi:Cyclic AMP-dependent transcription factor ATF-6 beta [Toxocara canis]|uniref:Cyclic AMP-dependent transcription factor ATF-6 beta n=1 Tax=Toxocara canis TaxID=6265 RepID=A0A0B2VGI5_TOXCA|nr:Cyclic AMP-dependent transcription factor ATF-6 beta [Toxocara canis]
MTASGSGSRIPDDPPAPRLIQMSVVNEESVLHSSFDKYFRSISEHHEDEPSLLPNEVSEWLDNSLAESSDQLSLLMRDLDFDIDLFKADMANTTSDELPLCNTAVEFESKLVDEIFNGPSSRQSPISADSGNHSPSSTSSEAAGDIWPLNPVSGLSDGMTSQPSDAFVFHADCVKKDECAMQNRKDLDAVPSYFKVVEIKEAKGTEGANPLIRQTPRLTNNTLTLKTPAAQGVTRLVPVQVSAQQIIASSSQANSTQQPVIYILPTSSSSATIQQQQQKQPQVYVQNVPNSVHVASYGINEGGCMRNARNSQGTTNRVQPYPLIRPKLITPKREVCSPPPSATILANPIQLQTMGLPTAATKAVLTPVALPGGLQLVEYRTTPSTCCAITRNSSADSGFDEFSRKKEDRKIRNRASAQLSRIRKRNEVDEMKQKLANKDLMIASLQEENEQLKMKIVSLQNENNILKSNVNRTRVNGRTGVAAGATCVFVVLMMVTFNGPLLSRFNPVSPNSESFLQQLPFDNFDGNMKRTVQQHGRALLSVDYDVDERKDAYEDEGLRIKKNAKEVVDIIQMVNISNIADCNDTFKLYMNQTEAVRLNNDLSNWVDRHERLNFLQTRRIFRAPAPRSRAGSFAKNASMIANPNAGSHIKPKTKMSPRLRRSTSDKKEEARLKAVRERAWRHIDMISAGSNADNEQPQQKIKDTDTKATVGESYSRTPMTSGLRDSSVHDVLVPASIQLQYMELARALKQRDDTLYVVAMKDYYLLPATNRNSTMRPRVALILPALSYNGTFANQVPMMRIECEITGTGLFHIAESLLPLFYNQSFYQSMQ